MKRCNTSLSCIWASVTFLHVQVGDLLGEMEPRCLRVLDAFTRYFDFRSERSVHASTLHTWWLELISQRVLHFVQDLLTLPWTDSRRAGSHIESDKLVCTRRAQLTPPPRLCRHAVRGRDPPVPGVLPAAGRGAEDLPHHGLLEPALLRAVPRQLRQRGRGARARVLRHHPEHRPAQHHGA